ncbi:MAG: hypothetical protein AAGA56_09170 [Myxococcota bacterium]
MGGATDADPPLPLHAVYHVVYNGRSNGEAPTRDELDDWVDNFRLSTNVVVPDNPNRARDAFGNRECTYIIETEGMTITWKQCSCAGGSCTPSAIVGAEELRRVLEREP